MVRNVLLTHFASLRRLVLPTLAPVFASTVKGSQHDPGTP